jgi:hypothetical protein
MRMNTVDELKKLVGRPLSLFRELKELRFHHEEDSAGHPDPAVDLTLTTDGIPLESLTLRARGVRDFHAAWQGRPVQVLGFDIEAIGERQMEGLNWRVYDFEEDSLAFLCREIEVLSCGELP